MGQVKGGGGGEWGGRESEEEEALEEEDGVAVARRSGHLGIWAHGHGHG
jgi:hypothetical protein